MKSNCFLGAMTAIIVVLSGCGTAPTSVPTQSLEASPSPTPNQQARVREYMEEAISVIQKEALNSDQIDWEALKASIFSEGRHIDTMEDAYAQVQYILGLLGDHHSHMMNPEVAADYWNSPSFLSFPDPWGELKEGRYGYIWMGGFASGDQEITDTYASNLQQIVINLDQQDPCAWVVDLRENNGGDLYAMVAGLGELIGDGLVAQSINRQGELGDQLFYRDGGAWAEGQVYAQAGQPEFSLSTASRPIVVLIGRGTISSGESLSLAFKGNPNAVSMGHPTAGLTTGNSRIELSDGTLLFITSTIYVDPTGQAYGSVIQPDIELTRTGYEEELGTIPEEVLDWLESQADCSN